MAVASCDVVNAPSFAGATVVTGHPPAQLTVHNKRGKVHCRRNEATGVATPSHATSNRASPIGADRTVIAACNEATANSRIRDVGEFTVVNIE